MDYSADDTLKFKDLYEVLKVYSTTLEVQQLIQEAFQASASAVPHSGSFLPELKEPTGASRIDKEWSDLLLRTRVEEEVKRLIKESPHRFSLSSSVEVGDGRWTSQSVRDSDEGLPPHLSSDRSKPTIFRKTVETEDDEALDVHEALARSSKRVVQLERDAEQLKERLSSAENAFQDSQIRLEALQRQFRTLVDGLGMCCTKNESLPLFGKEACSSVTGPRSSTDSFGMSHQRDSQKKLWDAIEAFDAERTSQLLHNHLHEQRTRHEVHEVAHGEKLSTSGTEPVNSPSERNDPDSLFTIGRMPCSKTSSLPVDSTASDKPRIRHWDHNTQRAENEISSQPSKEKSKRNNVPATLSGAMHLDETSSPHENTVNKKGLGVDVIDVPPALLARCLKPLLLQHTVISSSEGELTTSRKRPSEPSKSNEKSHSNQKGGVRVVAVVPHSPASEGGLKAGDVVLEVLGYGCVETAKDLKAAVEQAITKNAKKLNAVIYRPFAPSLLRFTIDLDGS